jgi:hypothetical protein
MKPQIREAARKVASGLDVLSRDQSAQATARLLGSKIVLH